MPNLDVESDTVVALADATFDMLDRVANHPTDDLLVLMNVAQLDLNDLPQYLAQATECERAVVRDHLALASLASASTTASVLGNLASPIDFIVNALVTLENSNRSILAELMRTNELLTNLAAPAEVRQGQASATDRRVAEKERGA